MNKGIAYGIGAYVTWGLLPLYWKQLQHVPAAQIISHRIAWSCLLLCGIIFASRQWTSFRQTALKRRIIHIYALAALLISVNWSVYIWAVTAGFIIEASLGYFINPLVNVLLGVAFLRERLRPGQWLAVGLAVAGVIYLTLSYGAIPWIALTLAFSFGFYGLVKKLAPLNSLHGLALETAILFLPALLFLIYANAHGQGAFLHTGVRADGFMLGAGLATTVPLLMFASAAQRIPLSLVGLLQYISPTLQFLLGVLVYDEPFTLSQLIGFSIIWTALIVFGLENTLTLRRAPPAPI